MKKLNVSVICSSIFNSHIFVPDEMNLKEAINYAKHHINEISILSELEYIADSDVLDEDNCYFEEN